MKNKYSVKTNGTYIKPKSGNRDDIIKWLYDIKIVENKTTSILKKPADDEDVADLIQELYLILCEITQDKWDELYEQGDYIITAYVSSLIYQQLISDTSDIYYKYSRYKNTQKTMDESFWEKYDEI